MKQDFKHGVIIGINMVLHRMKFFFLEDVVIVNDHRPHIASFVLDSYFFFLCNYLEQ